jgi:hypothetical protein
MTFPQYDPEFFGPHGQKRVEALRNPIDSEVRDILWIDVPAQTARLTMVARVSGEAVSAYFGRGLTLTATPRDIRIFADNPDEDTMAELERSGHSFAVIR